MATWSAPAPDEYGRWVSSDWRSGEFQRPNTSSVAGARFTGVVIPAGHTILSASLTLTDVTYSPSPSTFTVDLFDSADMPPLADGQESGPFVGSTSKPGTSTVTWDVAALLQQIVDKAGWASGNAIAFRFSTAQAFSVGRSWSLTLDVEHEQSVQYLTTAGPVSATASVPVLDPVQRSVTVAPVVAVASLPVPEVIAPRTVATPVPTIAVASVPAGTISGTGDAPPLTTGAPVSAVASLPTPTLTRTMPPEPPPIPWERLIEDPLYHEALEARQRSVSILAEVVDENESVVAQLGRVSGAQDDRTIFPGMVGGSVTMNSLSDIRWTCDLQLDNQELLPLSPKDLLHPLSHNRVRIWWQIVLPDGRVGRIPLGTYYPDFTPHADNGLEVSVRFMGSDAVAEIKRARWNRMIDLSGATIDQAIITILQDRAPWVKHSITPTSQKVPSSFVAGEPGEDPWIDIAALAQAGSMTVFTDRMGVIRGEPIEESVKSPAAVFAEGENSTLLGLPEVSVNLDRLWNHVTVVSANPDIDPPVHGTAVDDDPSSPLWIGLEHLYSHRVENAIITTETAARTMARNLLASRAPVQTARVEVLPHPHLEGGDLVNVTRGRVGMVGNHTLTGWTMGLLPQDKQVLTVSSRQRWWW